MLLKLRYDFVKKTNKDDLIDGNFGAKHWIKCFNRCFSFGVVDYWLTKLWITVSEIINEGGFIIVGGSFWHWMEVNVLDQKPINFGYATHMDLG